MNYKNMWCRHSGMFCELGVDCMHDCPVDQEPIVYDVPDKDYIINIKKAPAGYYRSYKDRSHAIRVRLENITSLKEPELSKVIDMIQNYTEVAFNRGVYAKTMIKFFKYKDGSFPLSKSIRAVARKFGYVI